MQPTTIKASEAAFFIRSRKHFNHALSNAGYLLPSLHSAMCTLQWMFGIRQGTNYCPKKSDRNLTKECHFPPTKEILIGKLNEVIIPQLDGNQESEMMRKTLEYMTDHQPDIQWLVHMVGIWKPDDEIFEPNYKFVRQRDVIELELPNEDQFWTSMPPLTEKEIRRQNRVRIPAELRHELALRKLEQKKKQLDEYELRLHMQIKNAREKFDPEPMLPQKRPRRDSPQSLLLSKVDKSPKKKSGKKSTKRNLNVEMADEEQKEDEVEYQWSLQEDEPLDKQLGGTPKKKSPKNKHAMGERSSQRQANARAKKVADQFENTTFM